jgi:hypothetical protein
MIPAGNFAEPGFPAPEFIIYWASRPEWLGTSENIHVHLEDDE